MNQGELLPAERIRHALEEVLARPEFHREPSVLDRILEWLAAHLGGGSSEGLLSGLRWVLVAGLGLVAIRVGVGLVRAVWSSRHETPNQEVDPEPLERARELWARARTAERRGEWREALRAGMPALLLGIAQAGELEYREAWTNRELLSRGHPSDEVRPLLENLLAELEPKEFGRAPASAGDFERLAELVRTLAPQLEGGEA